MKNKTKQNKNNGRIELLHLENIGILKKMTTKNLLGYWRRTASRKTGKKEKEKKKSISDEQKNYSKLNSTAGPVGWAAEYTDRASL